MSTEFDDARRRPRPRRSEDEPRRRLRPKSSGSGTKTVLIVLGIVALVGCCIVGIPVGVIGYFGYQGYKQASNSQIAVDSSTVNPVVGNPKRQFVIDNYRSIGIALRQYHDVNGSFPPQAMPLPPGRTGGGLSWRVALLPYLGYDDLYKQFKSDEPWSHPDNAKLAAQMPEIYAPRPRAGGDRTHISVIATAGALYEFGQPPPRLSTILDGPENTIFCAEASASVLWIESAVAAFDAPHAPATFGLSDQDSFVSLFCDGNVRVIKKSANRDNLKKAITPRGGERVDLSFP